MSAHLLSLSALHAAAPGVLDIMFGADGDFEGAPRFTGPVAYDVRSGTYPDLRLYRHLHLGFGLGPDVRLVGDDDNVLRSRCALDCRVPSVAARLAGLCARALGHDSGVGYHVQQTMAGWELTDNFHGCTAWSPSGLVNIAPRRPIREGFSAINPTWCLNGPWDSPAAFLASLTLALAPRIAALKSPA